MSGSSRDVIQAGSISGGIHVHHGANPGPAGLTPRQLPADVRDFVDRTDQIGQLDAVLTGRDGGQVVVSVYVIAGTAGAGKTSLALHWAHQVKERFPDGQLYVNLRGYDPGEPVAAPQALRGFLRALGVAAAEVPQNVDDAAAMYRSLLADRRMLVVLDNAATVSQVRPLLPGSGGSLVVVTSRSRLSGLAVRDGARRLTLGTLPEPEAVALLRTVTSGYRADDLEKLTELARLCARLPLALRIAAERAASHPHLRLDDLIAGLRDESALWETLSTGSDDEAEAVGTVFAWSYRALPEHSARLFRLLGLHPGPEFGLHAAAALAGITLTRARQLLDDLVGAHLLEQTAPDRYQFHDLLRAFANGRARTDEPREQRDEALRRLLLWYLHTFDAAQKWIRPREEHVPLAPLQSEVRPLEFADYDAAVDWSEREHHNGSAAARAAATAGLHRLTWQLAVVLWNALPPTSPVTDWTELGRAGLEAAERDDDSGAQTTLLTYLGIACRSANRLDDALGHLTRALEICRLSGNRFDEAHTLNLLGLIHARTRQLPAASEHFGRSIEIFRALRRPQGEAIALRNLAGTHLEGGRLDDAAEALGRLASASAANDLAGRGNLAYLMAELHLERGELEEARREVEEALEIALALRNRRLEGFWLITLGHVQQAAGQYGDALTSYQRAAMLHRRLGDRSREALAWRGAGETYVRMGRKTEGADFHRQAAAVHAELGDPWNRAVDLDRWAEATADDNPETAHTCRHEALTLTDTYEDPRAAALRARIRERLDAAGG